MATKPLGTVCIVGAGSMGVQIGLKCAAHGCTVRLVDALAGIHDRSGEAEKPQEH